eukprot:350383-Chlamydomonas_euryale.AAC.4
MVLSERAGRACFDTSTPAAMAIKLCDMLLSNQQLGARHGCACPEHLKARRGRVCPDHQLAAPHPPSCGDAPGSPAGCPASASVR